MDWSLPEWKKKRVELPPPLPKDEKAVARSGGIVRSQRTRRRKKAEKKLEERGSRNAKTGSTDGPG